MNNTCLITIKFLFTLQLSYFVNVDFMRC